MSRVLLGVNIDHVATLRQARGTRYPDPIQAALLAEESGADGITIHPREDQRHIQERDVLLLKETRVRPPHCCLVPEKREELTTEGGLDVTSQESKIKDACFRLAEYNSEVSLFIDADKAQIDAAVRCGAPAIEIHTGHYADCLDAKSQLIELNKIIEGVQYARSLGLIVNAGHGLHYHNTHAIAAIEGINELNIGHSIIARAIFTGLKEAITDMRLIIEKASSKY